MFFVLTDYGYIGVDICQNSLNFIFGICIYVHKLYFNKYVCVCIYVYIKYILICRDVYHFTAYYISITPYYIYIMEKDEKDAVFWGDHKRLSPLFSIQICINLSQYNTNVKMWYFHCSINSYMFYVCNNVKNCYYVVYVYLFCVFICSLFYTFSYIVYYTIK